MKKVLAIALALAMVFCLAACGNEEESEEKVYKIGMVCIGDTTAAYDQNFISAAEAATEILAEEGINIEWVYKYNLVEGEPVEQANESLAADDKCLVVFNNSYGQEDAMLLVAPNYEDVTFVGLTNEKSSRDNLDNTLNAFPNVFEARYLAGVAAGMKLNELIADGTITADEANIGYVGAYTFAEVMSGYSAFYLGAKSVCDSAKMYVQFIGSWGDYKLEKEAATSLIDDYNCVVISQHSDQKSPAEVAEAKGVYHVGYNVDMSDVAPNASIISARIDWTNYFVTIIRNAVNGDEQPQDYIGYGLKTGDVTLTTLNTKAAAAGTQEAIDKAKQEIIDGTNHVFEAAKLIDTDGNLVTSFLVDVTGDYVGDEGNEAIFDGYFHESYRKSAPAFGIELEGIVLVNRAY